MSKSSFRQQVSKRLLENYNRVAEKTVGEAARVLLQSADVRQCLVVKNKETKAIQTGYEAAIGRELEPDEGAKYRAALKKYLKEESEPFPQDKNAQTRFFKELVEKQGLTFGTNIFYIPKSFATIRDNINDFNKKYAEKITKATYNRKKFGDTVNLDHGADGTASGLVGSVIGSFEIATAGGKLPRNFRKTFSSNLTAVLDRSLNDLTKGQKGKIYGIIMKVFIDAQQIISKGGDLRAGLSMVLTPVLRDVNIKRGSKEEKQIQELFLRAFQMTFENIEYENLRGSSTLFEKIETTIIHDNLVKNLKNNKNIKIKTGSKRVKTKTRTKVTEEGKKGKGFSAAPISRGGAFASKPTKANQSNVSLIRLIGVLNQQLPEQVIQNMESPRLNYRTGRFASSVRVTDITQTAKGFPSIGYTYRKYPYQTFEPGYAQGDVNRDPRKLIDLSIREIAAQFAIGRFYTRRV